MTAKTATEALEAAWPQSATYLARYVQGSPKSGTGRYPTLEYAPVISWRTLTGVQRLFSMFPPGLPGLALLLLRASVAGAVLLDLYVHQSTLPGWAMGAAVALPVGLCAGYLTPVAAVVAFAFHGLLWCILGIESPGVAIITSFDAVALALLGPGAYSVDSYRFGRRVVLLPPD